MSFTARRVSQTRSIHLAALPSQVFPLFEPIGEKAWAEGWEPTMLFPSSGAAEVGAIFTTQHLPEGETIWTMLDYDQATFHIAYLRVTPGLQVGHIDIQCRETPDGETDATVTYTFTALSDHGNAFIARFTEAHYAAMMSDWERAINYYLAHGYASPQH